MDQMVLATQKWLNETYTGRTGWVPVEENGLTGWNTIDALVRAFQIERGSTTPNGALGPWTLEELKALGTLERNDDAEPSNIIKILQGAMWCKGYWTAPLSGIYDEVTENGIKDLQSDAGLYQNGKVNFYLWKSLLSMDQFVVLPGGSEGVRSFQQYFNRYYFLYFEKYVPCDGVAGRDLYTCFIYLLQKDEGYGPSEAFGIFGEETYNNCPNISQLNAEKFADTIRCIKVAIHLEGFTTPPYALDPSPDLTERLFNEIKNFNEFMEQSEYSNDFIINRETIKQLFTSNGYVGRSCSACDTATPINTNARAEVLKHEKIKIVGRYLTSGIINGENKQLTKDEIKVLHNNGLSFFPIYQTTANNLQYFSYDQGVVDAENAYSLAQKLALPVNTEIYFAVDYDMQEGYFPYYLVPYFEGINSIFIARTTYKAGVYGTRNVCTHLLKNKLAVKTFISNMSTGYSGNMGFSMPKNWSFNQFAETTVSYNGVSLNIDKIDTNDSDSGVSAYDEKTSAARRFTEEVLDAFNFRGVLTNEELPLGKEITLYATPLISIAVKTKAEYTSLLGNNKITVTKRPNGTLSTELETEISDIAGSFEFEEDTRTGIVTTLKKVCLSLPVGSELTVGFEVEEKNFTMVFETSTEDFEFEGGKFGATTTLKIKFSDQSYPNHKPQFEKSLEYTFAQAWAAFISMINNVEITINGVVDDELNVYMTILVIFMAALYKIFSKVFLFLG